jgi:hypothetical protein
LPDEKRYNCKTLALLLAGVHITIAISDAGLTHLLNLYRIKSDIDEENVIGIASKDITLEVGDDAVKIDLQNFPVVSYCGIFATLATLISEQPNKRTQLLIAPSSQTPEHAPHVTLVFTDVKVPAAHTSHLILLFALAWRALPTGQATHSSPCSS